MIETILALLVALALAFGLGKQKANKANETRQTERRVNTQSTMRELENEGASKSDDDLAARITRPRL